MTPDQFRRLALGLEASEESAHHHHPDFRVKGKLFATLGYPDATRAMVKLTPEQQADFVRELPDVFLPIHGGWGRMGMTHIRLAQASEDVLAGALLTAWKLRLEKNARTKAKKKRAPRRG